MARLFEGLKVLEFGGGAAGPFGTRYFADQGATVVRIESRQRPDFIRLLRLAPDSPGGIDGAHMFAMVNPNKLGVALNMSHAKGPEIARRLVQWCDVLAENFAPKAMTKWGLDYASLVTLKPDLIMISTCLNGQTGPDRNYPGFGGQGSALSGFNHLTGWPDREPLGPYGTITDSLAPRFVALLVGSALIHRRRTGQGQYIDFSQVEGGVACLSESILTYTGNGETLARMGNRSRHAAPHGLFRCAPKGEDNDRWVAIAVHDDGDWQSFREALGEPRWAMASRFDEVEGRLRYAEELEKLVGAWTVQRSAEEIMSLLQAADVEAAVVNNFEDLLNDEQLASRGHFCEMDHPAIGKYLCEMNGMRFSATPGEIRTPAPCLGQHSEQVYRDILGMSADEYASLKAEGVFE